MTPEEFVDAIRRVVLDRVVDSALAAIEKPLQVVDPGRTFSPQTHGMEACPTKSALISETLLRW